MTSIPSQPSPPPSLDHLTSLLSSTDLGERLHAVNQIRYLDPEPGFDLLARAAADTSARVRYAAISQIGTLSLSDPRSAIELLRRALETDSEYDVRAAAAAALGDLKQPETLADLASAYRRESEWLVQFSIVAAMGELGNPDAFDLLCEAIQQGPELVQTAAVAALGDLKDQRAIPLLEPLISAEDWQLRYRIGLALENIGGEAVRPGLVRLSQDPVEQVASQAQAALKHLS